MPNGEAGATSRECIDLFARAVERMADRATTESTFTPDLRRGFDSTLESLRSLSGSFQAAAGQQMELSSDLALQTMDQTFEAASAPQLLRSAVDVASIPEGGEAFTSRTIQKKSGARKLPWLDIVKEILEVLLDLFPIPDKLKDIIRTVLDLIDKFLEGEPHTATE